MSIQSFGVFSKTSPLISNRSVHYATISNNKVKIWNTNNGTLFQTLVDSTQIGSIYTDAAIFSGITRNNNISKSTEAISSLATNGLVAIGTNKGHIVIFKLETGEVEYKLGADGDDGHDCKITSLVFNSDGTKLYSASENGLILEWDIKNSRIVRDFSISNTCINKIAISNNDEFLIVGTGSVKLLDLTSGSVTFEYTGNVNAVTCISIASDNKTFLIGCEEDRFVNIWPVVNVDDLVQENPKKKKKTASVAPSVTKDGITIINQPLASISIDSNPISLDIEQIIHSVPTTKKSKKNSTESKLQYTVTACSTRSVVTIWDVTDAIQPFYDSKFVQLNKETVTYSQANCEMSIKGDVSQVGAAVTSSDAFTTRKKRNNKKENTSTAVTTLQEGYIQSVQFCGKNSLHVARYSSIQPQFEVISYKTDDVFNPTIMLEEFKVNFGAQSGSKLSDMNKTDLATTRNNAIVVGPSMNLSKAGTSDIDGDASADAYSQEGVDIRTRRAKLLEATGELTRALAARIKDSQNQSRNLSEQPMAGSLQTMLTQAIHSNNDKMLEQCIAIGASRVSRSLKSNTIKNTVARLAPVYVVPLISRLIQKLQGNPNRGLELIPWVRECLREHTTYLLTVPTLDTQLSTLYRVLEQRVTPQPKLLSLVGRLDLIMSQVTRTTTSFSSISANATTVEYNEAEDIQREQALERGIEEDYDDDEDDMMDDDEMGFEEDEDMY